MRWLEFRLEAPPQDAEAIASALLPFCYGGVALEPAIASHPGNEAYSLSLEKPTTIKGYLPIGRGVAARRRLLLERLHTTWGPLPVTERTLREEDWGAAWKARLHPVRIGRRLVVKPTWEPYPGRPGDVVVELDPGMAFGTGEHPTTRACLRALERLVARGDRVVDVGTGSGILAIAAAKLGAAAVLALDTDPVAVRVARANCRRNRVHSVVTVALGSVEAWPARGWGQADGVLANLTSHLHQELAGDLLGILRPGGWLVASGIGGPGLRGVTAAYRKAGAAPAVLQRHGEWRTLLLRKNP